MGVVGRRIERGVSVTDSPRDPFGGIPELEPLVRRVVRARIADGDTVDDLVQEALSRVAAAAERVEPASRAPYAIVTARNLVYSHIRGEGRRQRHLHRLVDLRQPDEPEEIALREEDRRALAAALAQMSTADREALVAREVEGAGAKDLAERLGTTPGAAAVRLTRARARLRVEYLLVSHRVELPTEYCKPVLAAISTGDARAQRTLEAGHHLLDCPPCAAVAPLVTERHRPFASLWPVAALGQLGRRLRHVASAHPGPSAAGAVTVGVGVAVAVVVLMSDGAAPALVVRRQPPVALSGDKPMAPHVGQEVEARKAKVLSVSGGGLWVGASQKDRVWVDLHGSADPGAQVAAGDKVAFVGRVAPNSAHALDGSGPPSSPDRSRLEGQGHHVDIVGDTLRVVERHQR